MKYNPVSHTITRNDGTPYLRLVPGIGSPEAYAIADILTHAPEWEKFREGLEEKIETREDEIRTLTGELDAAEKDARDAQNLLDDAETELTQARLRIEELEAMLASTEKSLEAANDALAVWGRELVETDHQP